MLALLLTLALAQDAADPAPPHELRFGGLRHVQLLEPRDGAVRFATRIELGAMAEDWSYPRSADSAICVFAGEPPAGGELRAPLEELAVGGSLRRGFSWTERPSWFLFELEGARRLAALVPAADTADGPAVGGILRVLDYPSGAETLAIEGVQEIEDAFVRKGRGELVARCGAQLLWLRFSESGELVGRTLLEPGLDGVNGATFMRGDASLDLHGWCVGLRGDSVIAVPFSLAGVDPERSFEIELDARRMGDEVGRGSALRLSAWASNAGAHLALGWPGYDRGVGKLAVFQLADNKATELWEGRPDPEADSYRSDQCDYGQAIAFVPDADGDSVPELLACGPWTLFTRVDLLSGRTGKPIERWNPSEAASAGHWLSVSADGARVLVGGAEERGYPENLRFTGHAYLFELPQMKRLATWVLPAARP